MNRGTAETSHSGVPLDVRRSVWTLLTRVATGPGNAGCSLSPRDLVNCEEGQPCLSLCPQERPHRGQQGEDPDDEEVPGPGNGGCKCKCIVRLIDKLPGQDGLHFAVAVVVE